MISIRPYCVPAPRPLPSNVLPQKVQSPILRNYGRIFMNDDNGNGKRPPDETPKPSGKPEENGDGAEPQPDPAIEREIRENSQKNPPHLPWENPDEEPPDYKP